jgi:hypothetical protein
LNRYEAKFGRPRTVFNLLTLPWDATWRASRYGGTLGPVFLVVLPALVLWRGRSSAVPWLAGFAAAYAALWASPVSNFQMRFLLPVVPALAVLAAEAYGRIRQVVDHGAPRTGAWMLAGGMTVLLILNLPPHMPLHERDRSAPDGWLTHVPREVPYGVVFGRRTADRYLETAVPSYKAWRYINTHLPAAAAVLTFTGGDDFYSERSRLWAHAVAARPATWGATDGREHDALRAMRRLRITHILFDRGQMAVLPPGAVAIAQPEFLTRWCAQEYQDAASVLYRIEWNRVRSAFPSRIE